MENAATMPAPAVKSVAPAEATTKKVAKEHWLVEIAGGITLATTITSALALWWVMLAMNLMA